MTGGPADYHGIFLGVGIAGAGFFARFMWLFQRARASRAWPATEGRILSSQAQKMPRGGGAILVYYEYSVDGRAYTGKRLRFAPATGLSFDAVQAELLNYRPGSSIEIHYNPAAPNDAVVETGVVPYLGYCIAGSVGFCVLAIALYFRT